MLVLARHQQLGCLPPPLSWDHQTEAGKRLYPDDLAVIYCANGHRTRMSARIHRVATDGTVSPSYVCTVLGCSFHDFIRLSGWNG
jgi:hypothetical protein